MSSVWVNVLSSFDVNTTGSSSISVPIAEPEPEDAEAAAAVGAVILNRAVASAPVLFVIVVVVESVN
mgnify:CR=1 FL=1